MVYKGLVCIEAGRVPHTEFVYFEAISKINTLMKFDRNGKRLRGSHKMHNIGFKAVQRWYIKGWGVWKQVFASIFLKPNRC